MKRNILVVVASLATLLATSAFAGEAENTALMLSKLAQDSSPANVKAVALKQKTMYCERNAKNKALQGSEKDSYINTCMNRNEAFEQLALVNRDIRSADNNIASTDINNALRQSPTGAGNK